MIKKTFKLTYLLAFALLLTTFGCSNDDEGTVPNVISVQDLEITIDENPTNGQIIGTVEATQTVGGETLEFSITSQIPSGALSINENTGELMVANAILFDFERNPIITATISVEGAANTGAVTINLNDLNELNTQDFTVSIDENPTNGQSLGTVQASGNGTLTYSIASQTLAGALSIDGTTGEVTVADATLFDFETNPVITANISVYNSGNASIIVATINLNDVDVIKSLLSTSEANYTAANSGDWIIITESEYNNLADNLNETARVGTTIAEYSSPTSTAINNLNGSITVSNTTSALIPSNAYIFAFKYKVWNTTNATGVKLKQSNTANNSVFSDLGTALPSHSGTSEDIFFVLKGNNSSVAGNGYLGLYQSSSTFFQFNVSSGNGAYWGSSDASTLNGQFSGGMSRNIFYQGLCTTQMQW